MNASLARKQLELDSGEEATKGVKATRWAGSTAQGGCRPPRLIVTDCSRFEGLGSLAGRSRDLVVDFEGIFGAASINEGQRVMLVKDSVPTLFAASTAGRSAILVMSVSLRGGLRSWRRKWPWVML